ncbi:MAG: biotin carboxylase N-terminal domain-containing protein [Pseudomonadota bacterium]
MPQVRPFNRLLIANRGEIACRVNRSAHALGLETVAVFTDADAGGLIVGEADGAVRIGEGPVGDSYLSIERIIAAAKESGSDAIHPGYGFLSENADFAQACDEAGLVFVGPSADAIRQMGNKSNAKALMEAARVPCVPGYRSDVQEIDAFAAAAEEIGYPVLIKAVAGGGGRGMRFVHEPDAFASAFLSAKSEALSAFGDDGVLLEKAILEPRHIEIQVLCDTHGNYLHLGERDCSVQRRYQKIIEEAPSPAVSEDLRQRMGNAAIDAARTVDYVGAGTVEFLLGDEEAFYFLEMNTRLQVEHPVTEEITGLDLVAHQLRIAAGEEIGLLQSDICFNGHAIETRLYAEDPDNDFLPQSGELHLWRTPSKDIVRVDHGLSESGIVSPYYDPMIAKVITHGTTRDEARRKMVRALYSTVSHGIKTNRQFLIDCLEADAFKKGDARNDFLDRQFVQPEKPDFETNLLWAAASVVHLIVGTPNGVPKILLDWSSTNARYSLLNLSDGDNEYEVRVENIDRGVFRVSRGSNSDDVQLEAFNDECVRLSIKGHRLEIYWSWFNDALFLTWNSFDLCTRNTLSFSPDDLNVAGSGVVKAPMNGQITAISVQEKQTVAAGDPLVTLEAMKMQHIITADLAGTVTELHVGVGVQVTSQQLLLTVTPMSE